jgi:hypothetical protein
MSQDTRQPLRCARPQFVGVIVSWRGEAFSEGAMRKIVYVSDKGDDKNDGFSREGAVYTWDRARKLQGGNNEITMDLSQASRERLDAEIDAKEEALKNVQFR